MLNIVDVVKELILEDMKPLKKKNPWFMKSFENAYIELLSAKQ